MIFDYYLNIDFNEDKGVVEKESFKAEQIYQSIKGEESVETLNGGYAVSLYRNNYKDSFHETDELKMWIFGEVFSSNNYFEDFGKNPQKLNATEVEAICRENRNNFHQYLKGSYVIIFYYKYSNSVEIITDRFNVLPLYYSFLGSKLIVSSNVSLMLKADWVDKEIDNLAMTMQALFDYMLGEYYFVKGIRRCENAMIYKFSDKGIEKNIYWNVEELYHKNLLPKNQSLDMLAEQMYNNVELYSSDKTQILISLTGGFDGRTNLALLKGRSKNSYLTYSYGKEGSKQIRIPEHLSSKLGFHYEPIYLDKKYLDSYYQNTIEASYFSNGTAPIGFSNIPFAFKKLVGYSDTIITGLFGSEILRPLYNIGIQVNDNSFSIFLSDNYKSNITTAIKKNVTSGLLSKEMTEGVAEELISFFEENYINKYTGYEKEIIFFFFIFQEGIRKYFSQEISIERVFVSTRFPYFDLDFIDLIYKTTWAGMYNGFLGKSKFKRRKGQLLYAHIIKKYWNELGDLKLDRGYNPNDLLLPFPVNYMKIALGVYAARKYMKKHGGDDTFKTEIWAKDTINEILKDKNSLIKNIIGKSLESEFDFESNDLTYLTYRHFVSIMAFLK